MTIDCELRLFTFPLRPVFLLCPLTSNHSLISIPSPICSPFLSLRQSSCSVSLKILIDTPDKWNYLYTINLMGPSTRPGTVPPLLRLLPSSSVWKPGKNWFRREDPINFGSSAHLLPDHYYSYTSLVTCNADSLRSSLVSSSNCWLILNRVFSSCISNFSLGNSCSIRSMYTLHGPW